MAKIEQQGTTFSFSVLPSGFLSRGFSANVEISVANEFVSYKNVYKEISFEELENWIFSMFRLLAGGYGKERNYSFETAGLAVDLYPYTENGEEVSREERRKHDCIMAIRLLFRSKKNFLGGVYSFLLHREEIERFAAALREEFYKEFSRFEKKRGEYLFVGVSPQGYKGCNYWYLDVSKTTLVGDYVWVHMGRHNTKQIVYVDHVRYCNEETAPCNPSSMRTIVKKASDEEVVKWQAELLKKRSTP